MCCEGKTLLKIYKPFFRLPKNMGKKEIKIRIDEKIIENFKETGLDISEYAEMLLKRAIETRQGKQLK
jgi:uncharacterized protein (DUF4415 family)